MENKLYNTLYNTMKQDPSFQIHSYGVIEEHLEFSAIGANELNRFVFNLKS